MSRERLRTQRCARGVTLLELMIVVAIVAILAVVVVPSYQNYITKARRTDAKMALTQTAQALERAYTERNSYLTYTLPAGALTENRHYALSFTARTATTFSLRAVPQGAQANDAGCGTFTIDQAGNRTVSGSRPALECWQ